MGTAPANVTDLKSAAAALQCSRRDFSLSSHTDNLLSQAETCEKRFPKRAARQQFRSAQTHAGFLLFPLQPQSQNSIWLNTCPCVIEWPAEALRNYWQNCCLFDINVFIVMGNWSYMVKCLLANGVSRQGSAPPLPLVFLSLALSSLLAAVKVRASERAIVS